MDMKSRFELFAKVQWHISQLPNGDYIGECDQLNLVLDAKDFEELRSIIHEGMQGLFETLIKENDLDNFLRDRGWAKQSYNLFRAPTEDDVELDIPVEYIMAEKLRDTAHLHH